MNQRRYLREKEEAQDGVSDGSITTLCHFSSFTGKRVNKL